MTHVVTIEEARAIVGAEPVARTEAATTIEEARAELKSVMEEFFGLVEKEIDRGASFSAAMGSVCRARPDLIQRENQLRDWIKARGVAEQSISASEFLAWQQRRTGAGASDERLNYSIVLAEKAGIGLRRMPIAMLGTRYKGEQKFEITRPMLAQVVANFRKRDNGEVPVDYEHGNFKAPPGQPVPAAGWIKAVDDAPDTQGILWGDVEWTPKAAAMIAAKEYKYISPVLEPRTDNKTGQSQGWTLTSAALTNKPVLQGMPALVLSEAVWAGGERMVANDWDALQVELGRRVKEVMAADSGLGNPRAIQRVMLKDRDFADRYREAKNRWLGGQVALSAAEADVNVQLQKLVREKLVASEGGHMDYGSAMRLVLRERPDLEQQLKAAMR